MLHNGQPGGREKASRRTSRLLTSRRQSQKPADDLVTDLPGIIDPINVTHHAGLIPLDEDDNSANKLFYWHFAAFKDAQTAPLVIWLNGGPGCSSMQGLFLGISPFTLVNATHIKLNEHSWVHTANILFVDQPIGTGMSFDRDSTYRTDESAISKDFYTFMIKFLHIHPDYISEDKSDEKQKISRPIYIFGESHAGRYIPQFSEYILRINEDVRNEKSSQNIVLDLQGVGIGNGWVHPLIQYDYSEFAHGIGLITLGQVRSLKASYVDCAEALLSEKYFEPSCFNNMNTILNSVRSHRDGSQTKLNSYDVREYVRKDEYPPGRDLIKAYMNRMDVRKALHGNIDASFQFDDCSDGVYNALRLYDGVSTLHNVEFLLHHGLRVLFYNGQWDMMCNHFGTERLLLYLNWPGAEEYQSSKKYTWTVSKHDEPSGFVQHGGNLTFAVVLNAGHMVPLDVPEAALDLVTRFIHAESFEDHEQSLHTMRTNATDLESAQCTALASSLHPKSPEASWAWIVFMVAALSSAFSVCVTIACIRSKNRTIGSQEHQMILQENSDDDDDEADEAEAGLRNSDEEDDDFDDPTHDHHLAHPDSTMRLQDKV